MYVIHKRIGVTVSITGVCFCIFCILNFWHISLLKSILFPPSHLRKWPKRSVVKKTASFDLIFQVLNDFFISSNYVFALESRAVLSVRVMKLLSRNFCDFIR